MREHHVDVAIIGAGTAGLAAYRKAKEAGAKVLLIESGPYGTTCARVGCMPSKLLIAAADAAQAAKHMGQFGVHVGEVTVDGKAVMERVKRERDRFVSFVVGSTSAIPECERMHGHARFLDVNTLQVDDCTLVKTRCTVIATGSSPVIPAQFEAAGDRLVINDDVFEWDDLPKRVAVFGLGVIGLELGQALAGLGVSVRLFGVRGSVGPLSDPEVKNVARNIFSKELNVDFDADVREIAKDEASGDVKIRFLNPKTGKEAVECFDYLLCAVGRSPNIKNLGLENLDMARDGRGVPLFNPLTMQCGQLPIFIAGDANAYLPLLHEAADEGAIAGKNAATWPEVSIGARRSPISVVFCEPQIMTVGQRFVELDPEQVAVGQVDFGDQGRSRVMLKNQGILRIYADMSTQRFLGAEMIGPRAENLAHLLAWSHQMGMTIPQMLEMPFYHPVIEEGLRTALRDTLNELRSD